MSTYHPAADYHAAIDQIIAAPSAHSLLDLKSRITLILGEALDVWPDTINDGCDVPIYPCANSV
ncbi:hypothetical protein [Phyllobacterium sp. 22552]|uniref:hypothetical protein n=1 Tax=Phyllobacterium sp. 22552 TaxID=3453941 RepID=UPI003F857F2F